MSRSGRTIAVLCALTVAGTAIWFLAGPRRLPLTLSHTDTIQPGSGDQHSASPEAEEIVATVNGKPLTATVLREEMLRRGADFLSRYAELTEKRNVLDQVIQVEVLAQAAEKAGYGDDPEIVAGRKSMMAEKFWRERVAGTVRDDGLVSDDEVRTYYESHRADYTEPERTRAAIIFMRFPPKASEAQKEAVRANAVDVLRQARAQPASMRTFGSLAAAHSGESGSRDKGGDVGWIPKGAKVYRWDPAVLDALFTLGDVGDIGGPVTTERGVYLVKVVDKAGGIARPLNEVAPRIRSLIATERRRTATDRLYAHLRDGFDITVDDGALARVGPLQRAAADGHGPPAFPVGAPGVSQ